MLAKMCSENYSLSSFIAGGNAKCEHYIQRVLVVSFLKFNDLIKQQSNQHSLHLLKGTENLKLKTNKQKQLIYGYA